VSNIQIDDKALFIFTDLTILGTHSGRLIALEPGNLPLKPRICARYELRDE
jgi:hypothetical protein